MQKRYDEDQQWKSRCGRRLKGEAWANIGNSEKNIYKKSGGEGRGGKRGGGGGRGGGPRGGERSQHSKENGRREWVPNDLSVKREVAQIELQSKGATKLLKPINNAITSIGIANVKLEKEGISGGGIEVEIGDEYAIIGLMKRFHIDSSFKLQDRLP